MQVRMGRESSVWIRLCETMDGREEKLDLGRRGRFGRRSDGLRQLDPH